MEHAQPHTPVLDLPQRCRTHLAVQATHCPRVCSAREFLDDISEEARHTNRRRIERTDQAARLDARLTGQVLILQQRQSSAISRLRQTSVPPARPRQGGTLTFNAVTCTGPPSQNL